PVSASGRSGRTARTPALDRATASETTSGCVRSPPIAGWGCRTEATAATGPAGAWTSASMSWGTGAHRIVGSMADDGEREKLPIKMLNDRILVRLSAEGERRCSGGILIPATAEMKRRLVWAEVCATGPNVRAMEVGDQVLFSPAV